MIWNTLFRFSNRSKKKTLIETNDLGRTCWDARQFLAILRRERELADRNNHVFAVVRFAVHRSNNRDDAQRRLITALLTRSRCVDEIGAWDDQNWAVILPHTDWEGAKVYVRRIEQQLMQQGLLIDSVIELYPQWTGHNDSSNDGPLDQRTYAPQQSGPAVYRFAPSASHSVSNNVKRAAKNALKRHFALATPTWKRTMDIVIALAALLVFAPVMIAAAIAVKLTSPGPVFFIQKRSGLAGRPFRMFKLRTMVINAEQQKRRLMHLNEQDGPAFKVCSDPRITSVGRFLRKTSIDELPQLFNVLTGEMSLVGPRPLPCRETAGCQTWHRRRLDVKPGVTCIWQTQGRSTVSFDEWIRMDIAYIQRVTLVHDCKLLFKTIPAVILGRGAK